MPETTRSLPSRSDNAIARKALEAIREIEQDAKAKKLGQLDTLQTAKAAIVQRVEELNRQLEQIQQAVSAITGKQAPKERRARRDLTEERERIGRWMVGRRGEKFGAGDLVREFPELEGTPMSIFLKPLVESGKVKTDATGGMKRTKYFVEA